MRSLFISKSRDKIILGLLAFCLLLSSCVTAPNYSDTPELTFVSMSKNQMIQSELGTDSLWINLKFTDGDGNVGVPEGQFDQNVTIYDSRTDEVYARFSTPAIPQEGANNGVEADLTILLLNECCFYEPTPQDTIPACSIVEAYPTNTMHFRITIRDQDGNISNEVQTDPLTLICYQ